MPKRKVAKVNKAKAGKGKKDGKQESKVDKESEIERARANAALWELRLQVTDESLAQYREACRTLARANEELTNQLYRQERESLDITDYLKRQDAAKEEKIDMLQRSLENQEAAAREEQNKLVEDYTLRINEMQELFRERQEDFDTVQDGMKKIEEFQATKAQMEQELRDIKVSMKVAQKEYRQNLNTMEQKFFKEKARLEREAEEKIALVMERAHNEAIVQLDGTRRSVFKENVRLNEALKYHIKEAQELQKLTTSLEKENASLALDKNTLESALKENAALVEAQKQMVSKLRAKVASLENTLEIKAKELERANENERTAAASIPAGQAELENLQKVLATRERELGHVKRLARTIVEQRTELEQFFYEALDQVKQEIRASRLRCKKEALQAYRCSLREATAGRIKFPPIQTFNESTHSTHSAHSDTEVAARWTHRAGGKVEMSDLTWEEKEQVLRLLFAKMNGQRQRKPSQHLAASASSEKKSLIDSCAAAE